MSALADRETWGRIYDAIHESIAQDRVVRVEVPCPDSAYNSISGYCDDCDYAFLESWLWDVWGTKDGQDFRLSLVRGGAK